MSPRKRLLLAVALALAVVASGCVSGPLSEQQEEQLADRVESELDDVDGYEATVVTEVDAGDRTLESRQRVKADLEDGETWQRTLAPAEREGDLLVSNGSTLWRYDDSQNAVTKYPSGGESLARANVSKFVAGVGDRYNVTVNGSATVDGTETHVVELAPERGTVGGEMTVWLDKSSFFPVKVTQSFTAGNRTYETTVRYENVTLDPEFEPGTFEYEPPADADVEAVELPDTEQFDSAEALRDAADQSVAAPDLPEGFTFERGSVATDDGNETVTAAYTNESARVSVAQYPAGGFTGSGEEVTVGGHDATLSTLGDTALVTWTCEDTRYAVTATAGEDLAREVAASIDC